MNWIERLYEIKNKDLYSQNGEGLLLEYVWSNIGYKFPYAIMTDIGCGDKFILSNSRHLNRLGFTINYYDLENRITAENCIREFTIPIGIISVDIDGYDYWVLEKMMPHYKPGVIVSEFNPAFTDSRTIAYNPDHVWAGDDYYGFSFLAGQKLAEEHGYKVIFNVANMNLIMVRADLIEGLTYPEVTYEQNNFFKKSERTDWIIF